MIFSLISYSYSWKVSVIISLMYLLTTSLSFSKINLSEKTLSHSNFQRAMRNIGGLMFDYPNVLEVLTTSGVI